MIPKRREQMDFEKVQTGDFINGEIIDIQYDEEHKFKFNQEEKIRPACRFVFNLEGYHYKHYSRWLTFSYGEKTVLYKKYLTNLVLGALPDMESFDLDNLKDMKVKMIWQGDDFQDIELIRPYDKKFSITKEKVIENKQDFPPKDEFKEFGPEEGNAEDIGF